MGATGVGVHPRIEPGALAHVCTSVCARAAQQGRAAAWALTIRPLAKGEDMRAVLAVVGLVVELILNKGNFSIQNTTKSFFLIKGAADKVNP